MSRVFIFCKFKYAASQLPATYSHADTEVRQAMKSIISLFIGFVLLTIHINAQIRPLHTVILILENHSYSEIAGNAQAPYINSLLNDSHTARLTQSYALTHPSQPNYIMFYSGSSQGIADNTLPTALPFTAPNLGASLIQAGFTFTGYSEDLPNVGYTGETAGAYVRRHNPWVNWQSSTVNGIPPESNRPFSDFPTDANQLPNVSIVVPNVNHDIHDGTVADCDAWIQNNLDWYIQWCKNNNGLFILTFDEDDYSANNQILTFFTGTNIKSGNYTQHITHYNVLRTIEELYQVSYAGASADSLSVQNIWLTSLPVQFVDFNATPLINTTLLRWQTLEENNSKEFSIERSIDGHYWQTLANIPAAGNSSTLLKYNYTDIRPANGINFYRIKQTDKDQHFIYSKTLAIQIKLTNASYKLYPNPAKGLLYIASTKKEFEQITISVIDVFGRLVLRKKSFLEIGVPTSIDISNIMSGEYFIKINNGVETKVEKLVIK